MNQHPLNPSKRRAGDEVEVWVQRNMQCACYDLGIFIRNRIDRTIAFARDITFEKFEPAKGIGAAEAMRLSYDEAQAMCDALWNAGLRPTQGHGSAGQLAATEKHLEDMRTLSNKLLGKVLA